MARKIIIKGSPGDSTARDCRTREAVAPDIVNMQTWVSMTPFAVSGKPASVLAGAAAGGVGYCSDGDAGDPCGAVHDGSVWRRLALGGEVALVPPDAMVFTEFYGTHGVGIRTNLGDLTTGRDFAIMSPCVIKGVSFYSPAAEEFTVGLWEGDVNGAPVLKKQVTDTAVVGINNFLFATPYTITWELIRSQVLWSYLWTVGIYSTAGTNYYDNASAENIIMGGASGNRGHIGMSYYGSPNGSGRSAPASGFACPNAASVGQVAIDPIVVPTLTDSYEEGPSTTQDYDPPVHAHALAYHANLSTINHTGNHGCAFICTRVGSIVDGLRIYDVHTSAWSADLRLWNASGTEVALESAISVAAPAGFYDLMFSTPYTITQTDMAAQNANNPTATGLMTIAYRNVTAPNVITVVDPATAIIPDGTNGELWWRFILYITMPQRASAGAERPIINQATARYPVSPLIRAGS